VGGGRAVGVARVDDGGQLQVTVAGSADPTLAENAIARAAELSAQLYLAR
jgi:hypothetical protein